ncbi:MAG: WGxxGxxG family protein [Nodosilinea sp.]
MQKNTLPQWIGAGALALSLTILPSLQSPAQATVGDPVVSDDSLVAEENDFDWGWLGLLGLIGLAGLKGRDRHPVVATDRVNAPPDHTHRY